MGILASAVALWFMAIALFLAGASIRAWFRGPRPFTKRALRGRFETRCQAQSPPSSVLACLRSRPPFFAHIYSNGGHCAEGSFS
jgi:hypothetical protein